MAIKRDKTICDIIPVFENGDVKKVYDHGIVKFNKIILTLFNQLQMPNGTLEDYPEMGCLDSLLGIYFSESQFSIIDDVVNNFKIYQQEEISVDFIKDDEGKEVSIFVTVDSVPNIKFVADLINRNQMIKIVNPQVVEV
ncbi:MAG: hypothetical protein ACOC2U_04650 [bacterium]